MATHESPLHGDVLPAVDAGYAAEDAGGGIVARGFWEQAWRRFRRDRIAIASGIAIILMILVAFIGLPIAEHISGRTPETINVNAVKNFGPLPFWSHAPSPSASPTNHSTWFYPLGTSDTAGHDEFLEMLAGAQVSLEVAIISTIFGLALGVFLGMVAGYYGGPIDTLVSRLTEIVMALPLLLFAIALSATVGTRLNAYTFFGLFSPGVVTLVVVITAFSWYYPARIVRAQILSLREKEFVEAARMVGAGNRRILRSHLLPHLTGTIIVYGTLTVATNILFEAGLSILGVGIPQGEPSWGNLINEAVNYYLTIPLLMVWPGLGILFATLAFNLLGDGLRDAVDPRSVH
jgi:peptide/nickel transport system permease protein